jgi:RNA polymerase sigma-70 factor (ECF subfamily)
MLNNPNVDFQSLDDAAILALIAGRQNTGAVGALYDRYGRLVYSVAIHVVGDAETAEEITQDVFLRAWEGAAAYRPELAKVSSWLVSIARHRAIDELRRRGVRPEKDRMEWPEEDATDDVDGADALPAGDNLEGEVEATLQQRAIRQVIAGLPSDQRQVLGLAFFQGLSHSEIATQLGEPLGTVKSRIRLAMQKMHSALQERGLVEF